MALAGERGRLLLFSGFREFLLAAHVESAEVHRIEPQRRVASFACHVGNDATEEGEQKRWAIDEQERFEGLRGHVLQAEGTPVHDLEHINGSRRSARRWR